MYVWMRIQVINIYINKSQDILPRDIRLEKIIFFRGIKVSDGLSLQSDLSLGMCENNWIWIVH